jgi:hypothetical protein
MVLEARLSKLFEDAPWRDGRYSGRGNNLVEARDSKGLNFVGATRFELIYHWLRRARTSVKRLW